MDSRKREQLETAGLIGANVGNVMAGISYGLAVSWDTCSQFCDGLSGNFSINSQPFTESAFVLDHACRTVLENCRTVINPGKIAMMGYGVGALAGFAATLAVYQLIADEPDRKPEHETRPPTVAREEEPACSAELRANPALRSSAEHATLFRASKSGTQLEVSLRQTSSNLRELQDNVGGLTRKP